MSSVIKLNKPVSVFSSASVVGNKEHHGPMGNKFDHWDKEDAFGMDTWERSEAEMQKIALNLAMAKCKLTEKDIDALMAGDLINQCTSSAYGLLPFDVPFFGLYGACSTCVESLILASLLIDSGHFSRIGTVVSSHNCSAERQFRFPLEYGGQRTPTSQWTVTGAAAFLLTEGNSTPHITEVLPGRSFDLGINDANDMGAAMAPVDVKIRLYPKLEGMVFFYTQIRYSRGFRAFFYHFMPTKNIKITAIECGLLSSFYCRKRRK